jgi:hypothetical protein
MNKSPCPSFLANKAEVIVPLVTVNEFALDCPPSQEIGTTKGVPGGPEVMLTLVAPWVALSMNSGCTPVIRDIPGTIPSKVPGSPPSKVLVKENSQPRADLDPASRSRRHAAIGNALGRQYDGFGYGARGLVQASPIWAPSACT